VNLQRAARAAILDFCMMPSIAEKHLGDLHVFAPCPAQIVGAVPACFEQDTGVAPDAGRPTGPASDHKTPAE
jgi:hypothetical protein